MDQKFDFNTLLERYLEGQCTPAEAALLERFFEQSGEEQNVQLSEKEQQRLFTAFRKSPRFQSRNLLVSLLTYRLWQRAAVWQVAASLLLLLACWRWQQHVFHTAAPIAYKQISSPKGKLLEVVLPDSSIVTLNANSTLSYAENFQERRDVRLTGEAFFNVTHDQAHPFIIHTADNIQTTVLGTSFTVRSYAELVETRMMVLSGKIQVQRADSILGILGKNEMLSYNRQTGAQQLLALNDAAKQAGWIRGEWEYDQVRLKELQSLLYNYYNVKVTVQHSGLEQLVADANMNFNNRQSAEDILTIFCITARCHYKWLDRTTVELYQ